MITCSCLNILLLLINFLLCWKLTFYCEFHPLLEFHGAYFYNFLGSTQQNAMKTEVEIKSNTIQNKTTRHATSTEPLCHDGQDAKLSWNERHATRNASTAAPAVTFPLTSAQFSVSPYQRKQSLYSSAFIFSRSEDSQN